MTAKRKKVSIFSDLYSYNIEICLTNNIEAERNKLSEVQRFGYAYSEEISDGLHCYNRTIGLSVIYLTHKAGAGTIAHECWHCVFRMMQWIGAGTENEIIAYTLDYLVNQVFKLKKNL